MSNSKKIEVKIDSKNVIVYVYTSIIRSIEINDSEKLFTRINFSYKDSTLINSARRVYKDHTGKIDVGLNKELPFSLFSSYS